MLALSVPQAMFMQSFIKIGPLVYEETADIQIQMLHNTYAYSMIFLDFLFSTHVPIKLLL